MSETIRECQKESEDAVRIRIGQKNLRDEKPKRLHDSRTLVILVECKAATDDDDYYKDQAEVELGTSRDAIMRQT